MDMVELLWGYDEAIRFFLMGHAEYYVKLSNTV